MTAALNEGWTGRRGLDTERLPLFAVVWNCCDCDRVMYADPPPIRGATGRPWCPDCWADANRRQADVMVDPRMPRQ